MIKEIPVLMTIAEGRPELTDQALRSLYENTEYPHRFYIEGSNKSPHDHLQVKNATIKKLKDWELLVLADDDVCFSKGWLKYLVETHKSHPDIDVLEATNHWHGSDDVVEEREDIVIVNKLCGPCCLVKKRVIDSFGGIPVRRLWTRGITGRLKGGVYARLIDETRVVHCGTTSAFGVKYSGGMGDYFKKTAEKVGAITR